MPAYRYQVRSSSGQTVVGVVNAETLARPRRDVPAHAGQRHVLSALRCQLGGIDKGELIEKLQVS